MERDKYYSLTDVLKKYKVSRKSYLLALKKNKIKEVNNLIDFGDYKIVTRYVKKEIIDALNLPLRDKK